MSLIDTHSHIYVEDFEPDFDEVILRAKNAGVKKILLPNIDSSSIPSLKRTVDKDRDLFLPMMGLHPTSIKDDWESQLEIVEKELKSGNYIAVGEIGIDLYWDETYKENQKYVFEEQLKWSLEMNLPVSIHSRNAYKEVVECLEKIGKENLKGVFHSFGGSIEELKGLLTFPGFFIGINGVVTYKNSNLRDTLKYCDINRIVLETDAPYLSPVPFRGKRNEPAYLKQIIAILAEIYALNDFEVSAITTKNALSLFDIKE